MISFKKLTENLNEATMKWQVSFKSDHTTQIVKAKNEKDAKIKGAKQAQGEHPEIKDAAQVGSVTQLRGTVKEEYLDEGVTVSKRKLKDGQLITFHNGKNNSFIVHPEEATEIKNLKNGETYSYKDETGMMVLATRNNDNISLKPKDKIDGPGIKVSVDNFNEDFELQEKVLTVDIDHSGGHDLNAKKHKIELKKSGATEYSRYATGKRKDLKKFLTKHYDSKEAAKDLHPEVWNK